MITTDNLKLVLEELAYVKQSRKNVYVKEYPEFECAIKVDFTNKKIMYPGLSSKVCKFSFTPLYAVSCGIGC